MTILFAKLRQGKEIKYKLYKDYDHIEFEDDECIEAKKEIKDKNYLECIICGVKTTENFSYENGVYFYIPICSKHVGVIKKKEKTIEAIIKNIKIIILT
jgi:hypothetical protein